MKLLLGAKVYNSIKIYSKKIQYTFISDFFFGLGLFLNLSPYVDLYQIHMFQFLPFQGYILHIWVFLFLFFVLFWYKYWHLIGGKLSTMLRCYQVFSARKFIFHKLYLHDLRYIFLFDIFLLPFFSQFSFKIINCLKNVLFHTSSGMHPILILRDIKSGTFAFILSIFPWLLKKKKTFLALSILV